MSPSHEHRTLSIAIDDWRPYGEHGVLIELGVLHHVHAVHRAVLASGLAAECVPGATTLYVEASSDISASDLISLLRALTVGGDSQTITRHHEIDVIYDGADLSDIADLSNLSVEDVIARHSAPTYTVAFLGFSRSFPYLAGLDPTIIVPRLATPRTSVPAGSVGMGAEFTGIYPAASPGGWRLLGRTEPRFFDPALDPPSLLAIGDHVTFRPVS
jgi:KipI family sensor histidine kinase inhibitor